MNRNKNDGTFFMPYEDVLKEYGQFDFCLVNDKFKYDFVRCTSSNKKGKLFTIEIKTPG